MYLSDCRSLTGELKYKHRNICNIIPHKKKESLVKGFLSDDTPCSQMHASKLYVITNTKHLHNSQLVMFK